MDGSFGDCTCRVEVPQGPYRFSEVALPAAWCAILGRTLHTQSTHFEAEREILPYLYGFHPPLCRPYLRTLTLESPWCTVARANKRVGLAVADSPYGPWKRLDEPILKTKPNTFYSFLTSNSSPIIREDGSVMMIFKGRHYTNGYLHSAMSLGMAYAPTIEGPYRVLNNDRPIFEVDGQGEAEDPFLWKDADGYHAIFKDHVAKFTANGAEASWHIPKTASNGRWTKSRKPTRSLWSGKTAAWRSKDNWNAPSSSSRTESLPTSSLPRWTGPEDSKMHPVLGIW